MFKNKSNTAFTTTVDLFPKIEPMGKMHETTARLYEAALLLKKIDVANDAGGLTALALVLNESAQTAKNWDARGVSSTGAIKAERSLGCRAAWIYFNDGDMGKAPPVIAAPNDPVIEHLAKLPASLAEAYRLRIKADSLDPPLAQEYQPPLQRERRASNNGRQ